MKYLPSRKFLAFVGITLLACVGFLVFASSEKTTVKSPGTVIANASSPVDPNNTKNYPGVPTVIDQVAESLDKTNSGDPSNLTSSMFRNASLQ